MGAPSRSPGRFPVQTLKRDTAAAEEEVIRIINVVFHELVIGVDAVRVIGVVVGEFVAAVEIFITIHRNFFRDRFDSIRFSTHSFFFDFCKLLKKIGNEERKALRRRFPRQMEISKKVNYEISQ